MFSDYLPFLTSTLIVGFITGLAAGFLFRKISAALFFLAAIAVVTIQILIINGVIELDWLSIQQYAQHLIPKEGIDTEPVKAYIMANLPFAIAVGVGFLIGFFKSD